MSVEIDPAEQLEFNRPFTQQVARYLKVRNPHDSAVAYKVKTTAPRSYCVRPNSGRIEPGQEIEVQVLLQAMKVDVPLDMKCKDKFLLQTTSIKDAPADANLTDLWAQIEKDVVDGNIPKDSIQQRKIKCVWGPPIGSDGTSQQAPPTYLSTETPTKQNGLPKSVDTPQPIHTHTTIGPNPSHFSTPSSAVIPPLPPTSNYTQPATSSTAPMSSSGSIEAQLVEAKAQIAALTKQLETTGASGLRHRTANSESSTGSSRPVSAREVVQNAAEQGVPVKIVAYLCLASFLLAYLFFNI